MITRNRSGSRRRPRSSFPSGRSRRPRHRDRASRCRRPRSASSEGLALAFVGFGIAMLGFSLMLTVFFVFIGLPLFIVGVAIMQAQGVLEAGIGPEARVADDDEYRPLLFSIAYRMLGSASESGCRAGAFLRYRREAGKGTRSSPRRRTSRRSRRG